VPKFKRRTGPPELTAEHITRSAQSLHRAADRIGACAELPAEEAGPAMAGAIAGARRILDHLSAMCAGTQD